MIKPPFLLSLLAWLVIISLSGCSKPALKQVTIGTGGITGVYYPTGGAVSRLINCKRDQYNLKVSVQATNGSTYNINAVMAGELDFGIAQLDRHHQAYFGSGEWKLIGPQKELRSVFAIHLEQVTLVASEQSGISSIRDLEGKRVNIGNPGSGQLQNALELLHIFGIHEDNVFLENAKSIQAPVLLQEGKIDAFFYTVGHPNGNIEEAASGPRRIKIIPITGPLIDKLINSRPYYIKSTILQSHYKNILNTEDIRTIGVRATFITSNDVSANIVYTLTKEVFENFETFKKLHPALSGLTRKDMLTGLCSPIHKGALKYYKESRLDKYIDPDLL